MKKWVFLVLLISVTNSLLSQEKKVYQEGTSAQQNINAIIKLAPYSDGAYGFDTRYEGVKGSPMLFEKPHASFLKVKDQDFYIKLESDIDLIHNTLIFSHPNTGKLLSIPADIVVEIIFINEDGNDLVYRTTNGLVFEKEIKELKFYQVLSEAPLLFIKIPGKTFREADYKGAYSADRNYDEYNSAIRYYIQADDNILHQIQLNKNSLIRLFQTKKDIIKETIETGTFLNDEEMVISVLEKF